MYRQYNNHNLRYKAKKYPRCSRPYIPRAQNRISETASQTVKLHIFLPLETNTIDNLKRSFEVIVHFNNSDGSKPPQ